VDREILKIKEEVGKLEQQLSLEQQREGLENNLEKLSLRCERQRKEVEKLMSAAEEDMGGKVKIFSEKYKELTIATISNCRTAIINDDYMPILNNGDHLEASADVPKRLMYFFVLLFMSLTALEIKFPRFLLIDTPDTAGIDDSNLIQCISMLSKILGEDRENGYQVILTTGLNKYPEDYKEHVFQTIGKTTRLLKQKDRPPENIIGSGKSA
jgi:hypothetical protein